MKKYFILLALPLLMAASLPTIPKSGKSLQDFVPEGWHIISVSEGDIDFDKDDDLVLALANDQEKKPSNAEKEGYPRLLVFVVREGDHYNLAAVSDKALLRSDQSSGENLIKTGVEKGTVVVGQKNVGKNRGEVTHRFKYKNGNWYLVQSTTQVVDSNGQVTTTVDTDYTTGKQTQQTKPIGQKGILKNINFGPKPATPIEAFNIGQTMQDVDNWGSGS
jgi:hypothetical protein